MKRFFYTLFFLIFAFANLKAQIKVVASAPEVVAEGEQFQLSYTVNTQDIKSIQNLQSIPDFEILYGPGRSSSHSIQIINGHQTSSSSVTYSYTLLARKQGTYTLPKLSVNVGGTTYTSNAPQIKVVEAAQNQGGNNSRSSSPSAVGSNSTVDHISNKDLFITVTANKSKVVEQEPILLTYRVYTRLSLSELSGKMPDLKGFMVKEVPLPQEKQFSVENYNGQNYYSTIWSQYVMFPQQTGKLQIPSIKFEGVVLFQDPTIDLIEEFFNGTSGRVRRNKTVIAPPLDITVDPLPEKPTDFCGAVGQFSIKSQLKTAHPKQNETLDLQIQISGTGNVDLIKAPKVDFPSDFDVYDPKQTAQSQLTTAGMNGTMSIDYIAVPRHSGSYTIPSVKLSYYDTSAHDFKTIQTDPITIQVAKGEKNIYADKQREIQAKSDIRYIKSGPVTLHHKEDLFWNRPLYWLFYLLPLLAFAVAFIYLRRRIQLQGDVVGQRIRGASRLVSSRLKQAGLLLQQEKHEAFYEELLQALLGYVSDKLNIPVSDLSKDRIRSEFANLQIPDNVCENYLDLLTKCEFYRFSQMKTGFDEASSLYSQASDTINKLEQQIKKNRKK